MSTRDQLKKAGEEHGLNTSSNYFKFEKTGTYKLRVLTSPTAIATHFFGKGVSSSVCYGAEKGCPFHKGEIDPVTKKEHKASIKFIAYVIDRTDGKIKLGELPWSVISDIADFEDDEDFHFDEYPMPYDIKVKYDKENKDPKSIYKTMASPDRTPISDEETKTLVDKNSKMTTDQYINDKKEKSLKKHKEDGTWDKEFEARKDGIEKSKVATEDTGIEYPEEEINPDDIPF